MFKIVYVTAVKKDLKVLPHDVQKAIHERYFPALSENPFLGKPLVDILKGYYSIAFSHNGTQYRIVYAIKQKEITIVVIMIGSRENFYKRLKRRI